MDRGSRSARPLTGRAGADRTRTGGRGHCGREPGRSRPSRSDGAQSPGSPTSYHRPTGAMAQLAAHLLCKQGVTGSSPVGSTTFSPSSPCSSTGPPLRVPSPPMPSVGALLPLCPPPCGLLPLMPSAGGPPPICSLVRAVRSAESSLWGAAVGGEAGSRAGDSAHRTGAARAARPGRLCSGGRRWRRRRRRSVYCAPFPSRGVEPPHRAPRRCGRCPPSRRALIRPGRRLARAVEDGDVGRRAPNASEPCGLRRPAGSRRPVDNSLRILARRCLRSSSRSNSMQSQTVNYVRRVTVRCAVGTRKPQAWDPAMHSGGSRGPPGRWIVGTGSRRLECRDGAVVPSCGQCCG